jgi:hypothetical protein
LYHHTSRRLATMDVIVTSMRVDTSRECPFCHRTFSRQSAQIPKPIQSRTMADTLVAEMPRKDTA